MDDDFFRRDYDHGPQKRDNLFAWTIFILLLTGFALACWLGSFYIFGHPENPRSYNILMKLHKIEAPKRFEYTAAPPGEFLTPQKFYEKYATMPDYELQQANAEFMRNYIRNYQTSKNLVPYLIGRFTILNSRELKSSDLFSSGVVALAQGAEYPQVLVEYLYTALPPDVPQLKAMLAPGLDIKLEKTLDLSAILHIEKLEDGRLLLTSVPLLYGTYTLKQGSGSFSLEPPPSLHLEGGVPLTKTSALPPAGRNYALTHPAATPAEGEEATASDSPVPTPSSPELVRVMPPMVESTPKPLAVQPTPEPVPTPAPAPLVTRITPTPRPVPIPATPLPVPIVHASPIPARIAMASPTPTPVAYAQNVTPAPLATPATPETPGEVMATPVPTPPPAVAADHPDVALHPFIEAKPTPAAATTGGAWKTFRPGQMPRGRLLKASDAATLADRGTGGERLYLSGQFIVTASGENSAVLRPKAGVLNTLNPLDHSTVQARIIVEFPAGYQPPAEGTAVSRDEMRPFEIRDVQRAKDGTINVMVREITTPE